MKNFSPELTAHLAGGLTTLATCWKLTLRDNTQMGFTSHDQDIVLDSLTYKASSGFTPSAVASSADMAVDNMEVEGVLDSLAINEADINAGCYDFAEIEIFLINYADTSMGNVMLRRGWLGEVSLTKDNFTVEVRGLMQRFSHTLGELYSPGCRAVLGDARCKINMTSYTVTGTLTSVTSHSIVKDNSRTEASGYFTNGVITFTGGANQGISIEVRKFAQGQIILTLPLPHLPIVGDAYSLQAGCDQTFYTCKNRFNNTVNFRGEPHVPGTTRLLETSSTRSK